MIKADVPPLYGMLGKMKSYTVFIKLQINIECVQVFFKKKLLFLSCTDHCADERPGHHAGCAGPL